MAGTTTSSSLVPITVAHGDGIGPEIMTATLAILKEAGARIAPEVIEIGEKVYLSGNTSGIHDSAWESLRRTKVFLKAPITTPQGGGYKSLNVTVRKSLGLFANVRPCAALAPFVKTRHPTMDVVVVRENEEDLYAGIEYRQSLEVTHAIKLISRPGSERIIRYAFEYARANGRKKVTCFVKDNIMKICDGLFHNLFKEVALEYPDIQADSMIVDIGAARLADTPEWFDVVVMENLYGDILSDVAAQIAGSVGLGASANIGAHVAMFEAIHGSAPTIAGKDIANPSGILQSAVMMLLHIGQPEVAQTIQNAWLRTIEDGIHTPDIATEGRTKKQVGTQEFGRAVIARLGQQPQILKSATFGKDSRQLDMSRVLNLKPRPEEKKTLVGVDVFVNSPGRNANAVGQALSQKFPGTDLRLKVISNRGVLVWPNGWPETFCTDTWRCRFVPETKGKVISQRDVVALLGALAEAGVEFVKTEQLYEFDGKPGYSVVQGQ
jgi:isocitrate dehydrogenase